MEGRQLVLVLGVDGRAAGDEQLHDLLAAVVGAAAAPPGVGDVEGASEERGTGQGGEVVAGDGGGPPLGALMAVAALLSIPICGK